MNAKRLFTSLSAGLPTVLVLGALGGIAYLGHATGWTVPSADRVFGRQATAPDDWCADHGVPESTCVQCNRLPVDPSTLPSRSPKPRVDAGHGKDDGHGHGKDDGHNHAKDDGQAPAPVPSSPASPAAATDWCAGHGVPESICTRCNPDLVAGFKAKGDWCGEHGLPESQCLKCNPGLEAAFKKLAPRPATTLPAASCGGPNDPCATTVKTAAVAPPADWCAGHGVPESACTRCNPGLVAGFKAKGDWCGEHGLPESQCVACDPGRAAKLRALAPKPDAAAGPGPAPDRLVQLGSADVARAAGIETRPAETRRVTRFVDTNAEVRYDQTRYAQVSSRAGGTVAKVRVRAGERVRRGDVLALVDSAEAGRAKAELLTAAATLAARTATLDRVRDSTRQGFRNSSELLAAEAEAREASIRLFNARQALANLGLRPPEPAPGEVPDENAVLHLGLPESVLRELDDHRATANLLPVVAPLDGVVVQRSVVEGEAADAAKPLFVVADTTRMWVKLDVPLAQLSALRPGQKVEFNADGLDAPAVGVVTWISTEVDDRTRTVEVRAEVPNPDGRLLANMFGRARVAVAAADDAPTVPVSALQRDGTRDVVFVKVNDEVYLAREVLTGIRDGDAVEVRSGLRPGDEVVVAGSYSLMSQLNRSKLGAGCADH